MNSAGETTQGSGVTNESANPESSQATTQTSEEEGNFDDNGYRIEKPATPPVPPAPPPAADYKKPEELESTTGYEGDESAPVATGDKPTVPPAPAPVVSDDTFKDLNDSDKEFFKKYATEKKLTPEQTQTLVEFQKGQYGSLQEYQRQLEVKGVEIRNAWRKELREDKEFGGQHLKENLNQVDKFLTTFLPSVKKDLTESKEMLNPSIMKDLLKISKLVNQTEEFVEGTGGSDGDPNDPDAHLDFYKV